MEEISESFKNLMPEIESKIQRLRSPGNDPIEYLMLAPTPDQVLLSSQMKERMRPSPGAGVVRTISDFLKFIHGEGAVEQLMDEKRSKFLSDVSGLFEDLKGDVLRIINSSYKAFMAQQPLLSGNPIHQFMLDCQMGKMNSMEDLENELKSIGMILYHKKVEKASYESVSVDRLREIVGDTKNSVEKSLLSMSNSLQLLIEKTRTSLRTPLEEDSDKLLGSISLPVTPRLSFALGGSDYSPLRPQNFFKSNKQQESEKKINKKGFLIEEDSCTQPICGKGRGIVCTQKRKIPMYFTLTNYGVVTAYAAYEEKYDKGQEAPKYRKVYTKTFDIGGEDLNHSISLNPSETYLSVSGVNSPFIFIMQIGGKIIQAIKNTERDVSWMFTSIWVNNYLIASGYADGRIKLFKYGQDVAVREFKPFKQGSVFALASDNEGSHFYCGSTTGQLAVVSLNSKAVEKVIQPTTSWIHYVAVDDVNKLIGLGGEGNELCILNSVTLEILTTVKAGTTGEIQWLEFFIPNKEQGLMKEILSNDSKFLIVASENEILVFKQGFSGFIGFRKVAYEKIWEIKKPQKASIQSLVLQKKDLMLLVGTEDGLINKLFLRDNIEIDS